MFKFVRSWVVGGALLAVAVVGCRHSSGCATCGHAQPMTTTTGSTYHETVTGPVTTPVYSPGSTAGSSTPMRMPTGGVQMIDASGR